MMAQYGHGTWKIRVPGKWRAIKLRNCEVRFESGAAIAFGYDMNTSSDLGLKVVAAFPTGQWTSAVLVKPAYPHSLRR